MKQFFSFIQKEFAHVFRDRKTLAMLFGFPIVQIILFGFALTNEIKNASIIVVDNAKDVASKQIIDKMEGSKFFSVQKTLMTPSQIDAAFKEGKAKLAVVFPADFNNDLLHLNKASVQVIADASDPNTATQLTNYITTIIGEYQAQLSPTMSVPYSIQPEVRMLYNPDLKGAPNFVPGVMAMVLLLVCVMMTSVSIVREKEMGTMEILLVSPVKPLLVIIAKAIPYLVLSIVNLCVILLLSVYALDVPIKGSVLLLFIESTLLIVTALALGLFISTVTSSQQSAMFASMLGMMLPTMLLSGYLFPIENMPVVLQVISNIVPARWYYVIVKAVMLKGLGFASIWKETLILAGMAVFFTALSLRNFKIRLE
ncbi:MAG TPA: ABC transporter permease [Bacteroidia bacterium]|jgi:ABC-2 type transport system permease protein|nr:ABC transporter permease [Bacteroidia bacterium]